MIHPALVTPVGWFGQKQDTVLQHSGEGPISAVRWKGPLIAYANDEVYILIICFLSINFLRNVFKQNFQHL